MASKKRIIGITLGDPGGVGPEVILKSFQKQLVKRHLKKGNHSNVFFVCLGSYPVLSEVKKKCKIKVPLRIVETRQHNTSAFDSQKLSKNHLNVLDVVPKNRKKYTLGKVTKQNGDLALRAIRIASQLAKKKLLHAIVTAPVSKKACRLNRLSFKGHTEYFAKWDGKKKYAMMLSGSSLHVVLATVHEPLRHVSKRLNSDDLLSKIVLGHDYLRRFVKIRKPRIGVAGLNPHAGEGSQFGEEETKVILPAIRRARQKKIHVEGPISGDIIFYRAYQGELDMVIAMYHDQGLAPFKMIAFDSGVNTTLGLSFVRTSPDHGTAFDIAGKNKANANSMTQAIHQAVEMTHNA